MPSKSTRELLADAANRAADYLEALADRAVGQSHGAVEKLIEALNEPLPEYASQAEDVLAFMDKWGSPATVASAGGRYFGFVTGGSLPAALAANHLAAAWDQTLQLGELTGGRRL